MTKKITGFTTSIERRRSKTDNHFNKERSLKYGITQDIIINNCFNGMSILELFGGIGMTTGYILSSVVPERLVINELDEECVDILKKNYKQQFIEIKQEDAFKWTDFDYDIVFIDGGFTFGTSKIYTPIFKAIQNSNLLKFVFTDVGVFRFSFTKKEAREEKIMEYIDSVNNLFHNYDFSITDLYKIKTSGICMMVAERGIREEISNIHNWEIEDERWKRYGSDVYKPNKELFFD